MTPQELPSQLRDKLVQLQNMQLQLQAVVLQKQQLLLQLNETEGALKELEKLGDERVYRTVGPLLIESSKEESTKMLRDEKEILETRIKILERQEKKLGEKVSELRETLQSQLRELGAMSLGGAAG